MVRLPVFIAALVDDADEARFTSFYEKHRDPALRLAIGYLRDPMLAEDAVQEAFIRFAKGFARMRNEPEETLVGALRALLRYSALDILRREKRDACLPLEDWDAPDTDDGAGELTDLILRLPDGLGHLLILHHVYGCTVRELSVMLRQSPDKVYRRLRRGRALLAEQLKDQGKGGSET